MNHYTGGGNAGGGGRPGDPNQSNTTNASGADYQQHVQTQAPYPNANFNQFGITLPDLAPFAQQQSFSDYIRPGVPPPLPHHTAYPATATAGPSSSSSPNYNRYGYSGPPQHPHPHFLNVVTSPRDQQRRSSVPDLRYQDQYYHQQHHTHENGHLPQQQQHHQQHHQQHQNQQHRDMVMSSIATPDTGERIGQYLAYQQADRPENQQPVPTEQWHGVLDQERPGPEMAGPSRIRSRRSSLSKTTDDEGPTIGTIETGTDPHSDADGDVSRPNSEDRRNGRETSASEGNLLKLERDDDLDDLDEDKIDHRKRKRNRTIRSCVPCHNHKRKCDRKRPCGRCTALGLTGSCVYEIDEVRDLSDPTVAESDRLRRRIAELEQVVRELRQRNPPRSATTTLQPTPAPSSGGDTETDRALENKKRRVIVDRFARFKIDEAAMADVAAAAAANRKVITGGVGDTALATPKRPRTSPSGLSSPAEGGTGVLGIIVTDDQGNDKSYRTEPYSTHSLPGEEMVYDSAGRKTFLGAPAGKSMLRRIRELTSAKGTGNAGDGDELLTVPEDAAFTGVFPDLRKTFPFTTIWSHENFSGEIIGLLPSREQSEVLLQIFREENCAYTIAWHQPSLEAEYRRFFAMTNSEKMNVPLAHLSLYLMICSMGCVMRASTADVYGHPDRELAERARAQGLKLRDPKDLTSSRLQSELYLSAAYQALRLCSFMANPTLHTVQAQILINVYLIHSERASDAWTQTGSLIRQAIAMGLHVDPTHHDARISMRDAEVKRRVWWTIAGLDALLCLAFGRPSAISFYTTNLPQDRPDETLSDAPGSAQLLLPPSNVLRSKTTEMTFHAAFWQMTIPSNEFINRVFHVDRKYSRSAIYGWFSPSPSENYQNLAPAEGDASHPTYDGAVRLADDIIQWYSHIPRGMRFKPEEDEVLPEMKSKVEVNQVLMLCFKTFLLIMALHRPYLRADPAAYPESTDICANASHMILRAYRAASLNNSSILYSWWTVSLRAFHACAVCTFLAIRQPGTDLAKRCIADVRGAISVFEDRIKVKEWVAAHPVQADLCNGMIRLERLATAAMEQRTTSPNRDARLSARWQAATESSFPLPHGTPLSQIRAFPDKPTNGSPGSLQPSPSMVAHQMSPLHMPIPMDLGFTTAAAQQSGGDGYSASESIALPQFWASVFGIKVEDGDQEQAQ